MSFIKQSLIILMFSVVLFSINTIYAEQIEQENEAGKEHISNGNYILSKETPQEIAAREPQSQVKRHNKNSGDAPSLYNPTPFINILAFTNNYPSGQPYASSVTAPISLQPAINIINNTPWDLQITPPITPNPIMQSTFTGIIPGSQNATPVFDSIKIPLTTPNKWGEGENKWDAYQSFGMTLLEPNGSPIPQGLSYVSLTSRYYGYDDVTSAIEETSSDGTTLLLSSGVYGLGAGVAFAESVLCDGFIGVDVNGEADNVCSIMFEASTANDPWVVPSNFMPYNVVTNKGNQQQAIPQYINMNAMVYPNFSQCTSLSGASLDLVVILMAPDGGEATLLFTTIPHQYNWLLNQGNTGQPVDPRGAS